jgi:hypothetical protein
MEIGIDFYTDLGRWIKCDVQRNTRPLYLLQQSVPWMSRIVWDIELDMQQSNSFEHSLKTSLSSHQEK